MSRQSQVSLKGMRTVPANQRGICAGRQGLTKKGLFSWEVKGSEEIVVRQCQRKVTRKGSTNPNEGTKGRRDAVVKHPVFIKVRRLRVDSRPL